MIPPTTSTACDSATLAAIARACAGKNPGPACESYLGSLASKSPGCFACVYQFVGGDGYARCLAPFVTRTCNHELTCAVQCSNSVCGSCSAGAARDACEKPLFDSAGACSGWVGGVLCAQAAFSGPGAFCNYEAYGGVGDWLAAVGGHYCH